MTSKRKRSNIDVSIKLKVISDRENGDLVKTIMKRYNLGCGTVCNIWKNRGKLNNRNFAPGVVTSGHGQNRTDLTEAMEIQVATWLKAEGKKGRTVTAGEIREQARNIHSRLLREKLARPSSSQTPDIVEPPFTASYGWLRRFNERLSRQTKAIGMNKIRKYIINPAPPPLKGLHPPPHGEKFKK